MAPSRQQPAPQFSKDEKVLCFHMDMLYEAKIMDVQPAEKPAEGYRYKVHYKGWKNTWDDWVLTDRIRPFDDEHKELAAQLHAQLKNSMQKTTKQPKKLAKNGGDSARGSEERGYAAAQGGRIARRGKDWELEQQTCVIVAVDRRLAKPTDPTRTCSLRRDSSGVAVARSIGTIGAATRKGLPVGVAFWLLFFLLGAFASLTSHHFDLVIRTVRTSAAYMRMTKAAEGASSSAEEAPLSNSTATKSRGVEKAAEPAKDRQVSSRALVRTTGLLYQFPSSNARGCTESHEFVPMQIEYRARPMNLRCLKVIHDHLTQLPRQNHKYLASNGRLLFDDRYYGDSERHVLKCTSRYNQVFAYPAWAGMENLFFAFAEDAFHSKPMINIPVPDHVQAMLVDDWENITKNNQLVPLPHPKSVNRILEDFLTHERPNRDEGSASMDILEEVVAGLREYFEKALSRILLYRFERHQYMDIRKLWDVNNDDNAKYKSVCDVYGAEHLARLIVSLPDLLAQTNMDQQSVSRLREEIGKFTVWLSRNCEVYFVSQYETPSQEYIDKARSF
ncbi:hypothetical protein DCS_07269 [Drechmeria coniospora]|uniref:Chromatin modification-related protein EAF3 n=1 Tax=Drechmeria coniospora TaxID=98403 RepID=A0A151GDY8_DRECN|nr:hypothetical protein DCS_07269 [Drechmeria coniospora]KYK55306.1 hypothetical protein DCS_07269 [Drechmeria coniospora]